ncbi:MAG: HAMP domain-containing histidine kinase [Elusimicrobia bacterium]|nr:HAMP domain-containing histidine kinase [Elusimicrobiota bacterium]
MKSLSPHNQELPPGLSRLIHNVNSKCASLKGGAELLADSPPEEAREILELMAQQAETLLEAITEYKNRQ